MFCQKCGNKLNDNASFCGNCGNKVIRDADSSPKMTSSHGGTICCAGCKAQLPIDYKQQVLKCEYCGTGNINPLYSDSQTNMGASRPSLSTINNENGNVKFLYESTNPRILNVSVSIIETNVSFELKGGESVKVKLEKGEYTVSYVFGDLRHYKKMLRIYTPETELSVSLSSSIMRNVIDYIYKDSIIIPEYFRNYKNFSAYDMDCELRKLGLNYVKTRSEGKSDKMLQKKGKISSVLVDNEIVELPLLPGRRIPRLAKVDIVYK